MIADTVNQWAEELGTAMGIRVLDVKDESATWVMNPQFEFICTHDGSEHEEDVITAYWDDNQNNSVDDYDTIIVCDNCGQTIEYGV